MITAKSYFSGAGGMDLGLSLAGIELIESYEIDSIEAYEKQEELKAVILKKELN
ncbi:hypothetical protein ACY2EP_003116 [Listeria innocua]